MIILKKYKNIISLITVISILLTNLSPVSIYADSSTEVLYFNYYEAAGMSAFRDMWNVPVVASENGMTVSVSKSSNGTADSAIWSPGTRGAKNGALVFDAVNRNLLVRFPGFSNEIVSLLAQGKSIDKIELVIPYRGTELWPEKYNDPAGLSFLGSQWADNKPNWHANISPLRKSWISDSITGPTFNAAINGNGYWKKYGAADTSEDRFDTVYNTEVSYGNPKGTVDITEMLTNSKYGSSLESRISNIEYSGFIINKEETYDMALHTSGYEWTTGRGHQGIIINAPRLKITVSQGSVVNLNNNLITPNYYTGGVPTAVVPSATEFLDIKNNYGFNKPASMSDWQWAKIVKLMNLDASAADIGLPLTYDDYKKWIDDMLARPPRSWYGHDAATVLHKYLVYANALPTPVQEHLEKYWESWLMADRAPSEIVNGYTDSASTTAYYKSTLDWRGNSSMYRYYTNSIGTQNFNYTSTMSTLLGGNIIGDKTLIKEGTSGLENLLSKTWSWYDGTTQESIDHYYYSISMEAQKNLRDFSPTKYGKMLGQSSLEKSVEEISSLFHPKIKRFASPSSRTNASYLIATQDGLQGIIDSISKKDAYTDSNNTNGTITAENANNMKILGHDFSPALVAEQAKTSPWAAEWMTDVVDNKQLPFRSVEKYKMWGAYDSNPLYKRSYLGNNYLVSSLDVCNGNETVPVLAQWVRDDQDASSFTDIGTLLIRSGNNKTEFLDTIYHGTTTKNGNGIIGSQGLNLVTMQSDNKLISVASPTSYFEIPSGGLTVPDTIKSLQTSIGLLNFQTNPQWQIYVDNQLVTSYPYNVSYGQKITIKDGVSYIGIIPISATNLGRDKEVTIEKVTDFTEMQNSNGYVREALRINAYMFKNDSGVSKSSLSTTTVDEAYGGFVVEMGDSTEYSSFDQFKTKILGTTLTSSFNTSTKSAEISYTSGTSTLQVGVKTNLALSATSTSVFTNRKLNGTDISLASGIDRETDLAIQGTTGNLSKNGVTLKTGGSVSAEKNKMAYIMTTPDRNTFKAIHPFPEPVYFDVTESSGIEIKADKRVGLVNIEVNKSQNTVTIDYAAKDLVNMTNMATCMMLKGLSNPTIIYNGSTASYTTVNKNGTVWYVLQLDSSVSIPATLDPSVDVLTAFTEVSISGSTSSIAVNASVTPTKTATLNNLTTISPTYTYYTSNSSVATFTSGTIRGNSVGGARVWVEATYNGKTVKSNELTVNVTGSVTSNIAYNKPAVMSEAVGWSHSANYAVDGSFSSYAQSASSKEWDLTVDSGGIYSVNKVVYTPDYSSYAKKYNIMLSTDNVNWVTVATNSNGNGKMETHTFASTNARFIRLDVTESFAEGNWGHSVLEFEAYGTLVQSVNKLSSVTLSAQNTSLCAFQSTALSLSGLMQQGNANLTNAKVNFFAEDLSYFIFDNNGGYTVTISPNKTVAASIKIWATVELDSVVITTNQITINISRLYPAGLMNLALDKTVTTSKTTYNGCEGKYAVDGVSASKAQAIGDWYLTVDLGSLMGINNIKANILFTNNYDYYISISSDGTNFTQLASGTNKTTSTQQVNFTTTNARYVRFYANAKDVTYGHGVSEIEIYGTQYSSTPELSSIQMNSIPGQTTFKFGENFNTIYGTIKATYSDASQAIIDLSTNLCSTPNMNIVGSQIITVTYNGKTTSYQISVLPDSKVLSGIEVAIKPDKLTYNLGEAINLGGGILRLSYSDGTSVGSSIAKEMLYNYILNQSGTKTIIVNYRGFECSFNVTVNAQNDARILQSISMLYFPKTEYVTGQFFKTENGQILASYNDNTTDVFDITSGMCSLPDLTTIGTKVVVVTYKGKQTSYTINVNAQPTSTNIALNSTLNFMQKDISGQYVISTEYWGPLSFAVDGTTSTSLKGKSGGWDLVLSFDKQYYIDTIKYFASYNFPQNFELWYSTSDILPPSESAWIKTDFTYTSANPVIFTNVYILAKHIKFRLIDDRPLQIGVSEFEVYGIEEGKMPDYYIGDASMDGKITINDLLAIKKHLLGIENLAGMNYLAANADKLDAVDIFDLAAIKMHLLKIRTLDLG